MEETSLEVCEQIIRKSTFSYKSILNYSIKSLQNDEDDVQVELFTGKDEFHFVLNLSDTSSDNNSKDKIDFHYTPQHYSKYNSNNISIKSVNIKGYDEVNLGQVDLQNLKLVLKELAFGYSKCIKENYIRTLNLPNQPLEEREYRPYFTDILFLANEYEATNKMDTNVLYEGIKRLVSSSEEVFLPSEKFVYIQASIPQKKFFFKNVSELNDCQIINIGPEKYSPLVYDLLLAIFCFSDQNLRQHHFHDLLHYFYNKLKDNLSEVGLDITDILPVEAYEHQLSLFTPYAKLEAVKLYCQKYITRYATEERNASISKKYKELVWTSILELNECITYPKLSREDCYKIVRRKFGTSNYKFLNYEVIPLEERKGFLGDYFKLRININYNDEHTTLNLFCKCLPTTSDMVKQLATSSFKKEQFYYEKFIPELKDLGLDDICDFLPKSYFSRTNDVLILDDLTMMGYSLIHISVPLDCDIMKIVIKQMAKIHACSLLYEEIMSEKTKNTVRLDAKYGTYVEEVPFSPAADSGVKKVNQRALEAILSMCELFPDIPEKLPMQEFQNRVKAAFHSTFEKVKRSDKYRNVLCQGDCWTNNILFKMDENKTPNDCCIVDYQLTRYCPPAADLFFLIYMVTDRETRTKYMAKFIDEYYLQLSNILQKYKFDLDKIYPYDVFLDSCNYMKSQGLWHACIILQMVLYPEDKWKGILEDELSMHVLCEDRTVFMEEMRNDGQYRSRMRGLIEDLYEVCLNNNF